MTIVRQAQYSTSIASWSLAIAKALDFYGHDANSIFSEAGIELNEIDSSYNRLPVELVQKVWQFAESNTDEYFGFKVSEFLTPSSFESFGFGLYASTSIKDMLTRLIRYRCVISHMFFAELLETKDQYIFSTIDKRQIQTSITHDALTGYILKIARDIDHPGFTPVKMCFNRDAAESTEKFSALIQAPLEFNTEGNTIIFSKEQLERPLQNGSTSLGKTQDQLTEQYIAKHHLVSEYMLRVKTAIIELLAQEEINVNAVANKLHITVRTLQRRLSAENSSYHELLDKIRHDQAIEYASNESISPIDMALKLGFTDRGSFSRSFKRWTKQSLSEYRSALKQKKNDSGEIKS